MGSSIISISIDNMQSRILPICSQHINSTSRMTRQPDGGNTDQLTHTEWCPRSIVSQANTMLQQTISITANVMQIKPPSAYTHKHTSNETDKFLTHLNGIEKKQHTHQAQTVQTFKILFNKALALFDNPDYCCESWPRTVTMSAQLDIRQSNLRRS